MENVNNSINEAAISTSLLAYFTSKEFLMTAGGAGALAAIITYLKGAPGKIQRRFRKVSKMLVKMQTQFGSEKSNGLDMNNVLPGKNLFSGKSTKGALGIYPFVNHYKAEIDKDYEYLSTEFEDKLNTASTNQAKAEVCYAMLQSFCNKYFNQDVVENKLRAKDSKESQDQFLLNTFTKIITAMKSTQSDDSSQKISPFYSRVYKNYEKMVDRYIKLCTAIVNNFKKHTVINGEIGDEDREKQENQLEAAVQKFGAEIDRQKDGYMNNFYRVINTLISYENYIKTVDLMLEKVIPAYKELIDNGEKFAEGKKSQPSTIEILKSGNTKLYDIKSDNTPADEEEFIFITTPKASASEETVYEEDKQLNEDGEEANNVKIVTVVKGNEAFKAKIPVSADIENKLQQFAKDDNKKEQVLAAKEDIINSAKDDKDAVLNAINPKQKQSDETTSEDPTSVEDNKSIENPQTKQSDETKPEEPKVEQPSETPETSPEETSGEEQPAEQSSDNKSEEIPAEEPKTEEPSETPETKPEETSREEKHIDNQPAEQSSDNKSEEIPAEENSENKSEETSAENNKEEKSEQEQGLVKQSNQYLTRLSNNEVIKLGAVSQITELNGKEQEVQQDTFFKRLFNKFGNLLKKIYYFFVNRFGKYKVRVVPGTNAKPEVVTSLVHTNNLPQQVDIYTIEMGQAEDGTTLHGTCDKDGNFIVLEISKDGNVQILDKSVADRIRKEMENTENAKNFVLRKVNGTWQWVPIKQQQQVESINIEYSKLFNLAESFMGTLSYLNVHRNISIDSNDNYYVLSENAWGDGSNSDPVNYLHKKLNESISNLNTYDDFVKYAKSSVSVNFIPVNEEEYKTSLPYNRYQMLTESNPLYESLLFVSFNNDDERTVKHMIKVQDIQKIVG